MGNENRDIAPVLIKFGAALALSFGGALYTLIVNRRSKASRSPPDHRKVSDCNKQVNSRNNHLHFDPLATDNQEELHHSNNLESTEKDTHEQEIKSLRNTVRTLKERESNLEIKLLEYYGLKEQETAVMEFQKRLKLNNMEAKLFTLKLESLQADNRRLEEHITDHKKVVADLEAARTKIKMLKKKIKSESEKNEKQISDFQQQIQKMQEDEHKIVSESEKNKKLISDFQQQVQKMQEDEEKIVSELEELRKSNHDLQQENTDLAHRLDCVQLLATSVLEDGETEKVKEESQLLKTQNEDLSKENERLKADRCADVEELVYLRWINACLRYELRNYQPKPGKTTARDLGKKLSPRSEEKAKQLIVEYADREGGIDSEQWSISQASIITDTGEFDQSFIDDQLRYKNSNTFFGKLMRVIRGKDSHSRSSSLGKIETGGDEVMSSGGSKRLTHRHSDSSFYEQVDSVAGKGSGRRRRSCSSGGPKSELAKYAEALKDSRTESLKESRAKSNFKSHKSSPTLCFF